jgi:hypothetical protein
MLLIEQFRRCRSASDTVTRYPQVTEMPSDGKGKSAITVGNQDRRITPSEDPYGYY